LLHCLLFPFFICKKKQNSKASLGFTKHFPFFHFQFSYLFMYKSKMPTFFTLFS
jgi:hypothetical protein